MTAASLIADLRVRGVAVKLAGVKVRIEDREGRVAAKEMDFLRQHKAGIIAYLSASAGHPCCAFFCGKVSSPNSHDPRLPDKYCRVCGGTFADYFENVGNFFRSDTTREFRIEQYDEDDVA